MNNTSHIPLELFGYLLLFMFIQILILRASTYIKNYVNGRNDQIINQLIEKDLQELLAFRQTLRNDTRLFTNHTQWMLSLVVKAINIKVQRDVEKRNALIQQQLAEKAAREAARKAAARSTSI